MALTTLANVLLMPGMGNAAANPPAYLEMLVAAADAMVKKFLKRNIELAEYTEYHSGNEMPDLVLRQYPVLSATTTLADSMDGLALPQATIEVESTEGFSPDGGTVSVQVTPGSFTAVTYTAKTATELTGCAGGVGTLNSSTGWNYVATPPVWCDPNGRYGRNPQGFGDGTLLSQGNSYSVVVDGVEGQLSHRGLVRRTGGPGGASMGGFWPSQGSITGGKLSSYRLPCWPRGQGNIKVMYTAGYETVPADLTYAATMLVAYAVRNMKMGGALSSESLGAYSYSIMQQSNEIPELGSMSVTLRRYREVSW